jgi:antitoxin MazE
MKAKAQRWGNSLAVRIPKAIAEEAGVGEEDELEIDVVANVIRMKPRRRPASLDELLERITTDNLHGEVDFGRPKGRETW